MEEIIDKVLSKFQPRSLVISLSNRCTAACDGCAFGCHPWVELEMPVEDALSTIDKVKQELPSIALVVVTGGEPLLQKESLLKVIRHARSQGFSTRVVSNAYWATTCQATESTIEELMEAGLDEINFSTGDEHAKFVPLDNVLLATEVALNKGMVVALMVEVRKNARITPELVKSRLSKSAAYMKNKSKLYISPSPWMSVENVDILPGAELAPSEILLNNNSMNRHSGCQSVLSDVLVQPTGDTYSCCGLTVLKIPEMLIGNIKNIDLGESMSEEIRDLLKLWIAIDGPEYIMAWAASKDNSITWENRYAHACEVCYWLFNNDNIRNVIMDNSEEIISKVMYRLATLPVVARDRLLSQADPAGGNGCPA